jgi:hypothetical protein
MPVIGHLRLQDREGTAIVFEVRIEPERRLDGERWHFVVRPVEPADGSDESYFATVREIGPEVARVDTTTNALPQRFHGCGISRALFPRVASTLNRTLQSSRNAPLRGSRTTAVGGVSLTVSSAEESLSPPARAVWERLVREGLATFDARSDRFNCRASQQAF